MKEPVNPTNNRMKTTIEHRDLDRESSAARAIAEILRWVDSGMSSLRRHPYFESCEDGSLELESVTAILKQLYCFSVMFERLMARRLAILPPRTPAVILDSARRQLYEEAGHVELFRNYLLRNGVDAEELSRCVPSTLTKALAGYLLATIEQEQPIVGNVAMLQVMEPACLLFFNTTLRAHAEFSCNDGVLFANISVDPAPAVSGIEACAGLDEQQLGDCRRVIADLFRLLPLVLNDWLTLPR